MIISNKQDKKVYNIVSWIAWSYFASKTIENIKSFQNGAWSEYHPKDVLFVGAAQDEYYNAGVKFMKKYKTENNI